MFKLGYSLQEVFFVYHFSNQHYKLFYKRKMKPDEADKMRKKPRDMSTEEIKTIQ